MVGLGAAIGRYEGVGDENGDGSAPIAEAAERVTMTAAAAAARTKLSIILKMTFRLHFENTEAPRQLCGPSIDLPSSGARCRAPFGGEDKRDG